MRTKEEIFGSVLEGATDIQKSNLRLTAVLEVLLDIREMLNQEHVIKG